VSDLIEGEAEPLATQDELEPYPVPIVKDSSRAVAAPEPAARDPRKTEWSAASCRNSSASSPIVQVRSLITVSFARSLGMTFT
jgi:hypothetical protein